MSRKRKASLRKRAEEMNEAKSRVRMAGVENTMEGPSTMVSEDLIDLPAPVGMEESYSSDEEDLHDEDYEGALTSENRSAIYNDWISEMKRIDKQKMAMMLYDDYVDRRGMQKTQAAMEVGLFFGVNDKTVRLWRRDFLCNGGEFSEDSRGKYVRHQVIFDEGYRDRALDWVRSNSSVKGKPNMVASDFVNG